MTITNFCECVEADLDIAEFVFIETMDYQVCQTCGLPELGTGVTHNEDLDAEDTDDEWKPVNNY